MRSQLLQGNPVEHHHVPFKKKDGNTVNVSLTMSPIINDESEFIGFSSIARDVTKEMEIDKVKSEFVSIASHQLRTPLAAILWYAELLLNGKAGKLVGDQKDFISEIFSSTRRMTHLVNDLLNVSRLELGTFSVGPEKINLVEEFKIILNIVNMS